MAVPQMWFSGKQTCIVNLQQDADLYHMRRYASANPYSAQSFIGFSGNKYIKPLIGDPCVLGDFCL